MTTIRATFTVEHEDGAEVEEGVIRQELEDALDDIATLYVSDDKDREGEYSVTALVEP